MKKSNNKGFMLIETLVVTVFVAGVLIFLYMQFSNLSKSYDESYIYNITEGLYALEDLRSYMKQNPSTMNYLEENIGNLKFIDLTDCSLFNDKTYCYNLMKLENIDKVFFSTNLLPKNIINNYDEGFTNFIDKIIEEGEEPYRLVASFNNNTYATLRLGDKHE